MSSSIRFLTPMRGIAALLIAFKHTLIWLPGLRIAIDGITAFSSRSYIWVDFFFILSGFILCHVYGQTFSSDFNRSEYSRFLRARFARIYPLYLFSLLLFAMVIVYLWLIESNPGGDRFSPASFFSNLLMVQALSIHKELTWNFAAWSVSVEFLVYLLFPFIIATMFHKIGRWLLPLAALVLFTLVYRIKGNLDFHFDYGIVRCATEFILGVFAYQWGYKKGPDFFRSSYVPALMLMLITIAILHVEPTVIADYWLVLVMAGLILALANYQGNKLQILDSKQANWLGNISYSIYLNHLLLLELPFMLFWPEVHDQPNQFHPSTIEAISLVSLAIILILAVSHLTYNFIEKPARTWLNKA